MYDAGKLIGEQEVMQTMKWMKQLRCKMRAMRRRPKVYARHYVLALFLRGMLLFLEVVLLRFFIYAPLRLADISPKEFVQYMRKFDFPFWAWLKSGLSRCMEVKNWLQSLGNFASLPEAFKHLNARLYVWLQWKRAAVMDFLRMLRRPRQLLQRMWEFLCRQFRNRRMVRRGAFRMVLGVILAKLLTVLYVTFAGAAIFSVWGIDCLFMILGFLQLAATRIAHVLGRVIAHHIYLVQQGSTLLGEGQERTSSGKQE